MGPNNYKVLFIATGLTLYTQLRWHDERQCNNQPDKRHKRGSILIVLAGSDGTMAQLVVSAPQWLGDRDNENGGNDNNNNNAEMTTTHTASTGGGALGSMQERTQQLHSAKGRQHKANAFDTNNDVSNLQ